MAESVARALGAPTGLVATLARDGGSGRRRRADAQMSGAPDELGEWDVAMNELVVSVNRLLHIWMRGGSLAELQSAAIELRLARADPLLIVARKFVLRVIPEVAFVYSLPALVLAYQGIPLDGADVTSLSACVREGYEHECEVGVAP